MCCSLFTMTTVTSQSKTPPSPPSSDPYTSECTAMRQEPQERLEKLHEDRAGISERINEVFRGTSQSKTPPPSPDPYTSECTAMRQELQERLEKLHEDMAGISARINEVFRGTSQSKTPPPSPDPYSSECTTMRQESQERLEKVHEHRAGISERINQVFRGTSQSKTPPPPPSPDPNTSECTTMLQESQERLEKLHEDRAGISERINEVFRGTSQSKTPPPLPSPDPYTSERMTMRQELQERLEKLHEDRAVISESINQVFRGVDMIVEYVNSLTDMSEFYSGFVAACAAMEQLSIKLFRIGLLLNRENNLIGASQQQRSSEGATVNDGSVDQFSGATQQRPPDATVTSPGSSDVSEEATVIDGGKDLLSGANQQKSPDVTRTSPSSCDDFKEETIIDGGKDLPSSVNQQKSPDVTITSPSSCDDFKKETIIDGGKDLPSGVNEQKSPDVTRTSFSSCDNSEDASMIDGGKDLYSDANQQKSPDVTITFPSSSEDSDGSEEGTLIYGEDLHSISRDDVEKPQNTSEASPQHVSVCEEITTSAAASFVRLQRNIPSVLPPDRAASRGASSKIVGIASKMPVVIAHRRITPRAKADVVGVPVPVKQRPSARPISVTGFDQYCREQRERNKVSEIVSSAAQSRVAVTAAIFVQSQSGQTEAPGGDTSSFTASQEALNPSTSLVRRSAAGRELSILEYDEIPLYYPDIIRTTQDVVLSFYKNPAEFWLQLATSAQQLETFARELHEHYSCVAAQRQGFTARPGMSCAAFYTEDGRWYRAKIVGVFQGYVVVYYVDFGNTDTVDLNNLCPLDRQFASLPEQALYCGIKGLKVPWGSQTFSLEAMRSFRERISARNIKLQAFFHARELNTHYLVDIVARPVEEAVMNLSQEFLGLCIEEGSQLIHTSQDNENFMRTCDPFFGRKALESSIATPPSGVHSMPPVVPLSSMPTTVSTASGMLSTRVLSSYTNSGPARTGSAPAVALGPPPADMPPAHMLPAHMLQAKVFSCAADSAGLVTNRMTVPRVSSPALCQLCMASAGMVASGTASPAVDQSVVNACVATTTSEGVLGTASASVTVPGMALSGLTPGMTADDAFITSADMSTSVPAPAVTTSAGWAGASMTAPLFTPAVMATSYMPTPGVTVAGMASSAVALSTTAPLSVPLPDMAAAGMTSSTMSATSVSPHVAPAGITPFAMAPSSMALSSMALPGMTAGGMTPSASAPLGMAAAGMVSPVLAPISMAPHGMVPAAMGMASHGTAPATGIASHGVAPATGMALHGMAPAIGMASRGIAPAMGMASRGMAPAGTGLHGMASAGMTPHGTALTTISSTGIAAGTAQPSVAAASMIPPSMVSPRVAPPDVGTPGMPTACMAASDVSTPGFTAVGMAAAGWTATTMAAPGSTPTVLSVPGSTATGMSIPSSTLAYVMAPVSTPVSMIANSMATPASASSNIAVPTSTQTSMATAGSTPASTTDAMATPCTESMRAYDPVANLVPSAALHGLNLFGLGTPGLPAALASPNLTPGVVQDISEQQVNRPSRLLSPATVPPAVVPEGNSFHVMLSVVYSPTDFYVQIIDHANTTAKVLEELQHHLNMHSIQTLPPSDPAVTRGSFWACFYEEDRNWYRVQVLDVLLTANHAKRFRVLCVDYGNRITVSSTYLRSLPYSLSGLPACAHRLALAHVAPRDGLMWDAVATGTFVRATGFKDVYFAEKKGERTISLENVIDVVLWKKTEMVTVNINALLLEKAVAVMKP